MNKPLVSCLMLTYNRFKAFKISVDNYIKQTYNNKELIIINSGNDDYTKKITEFLTSIDSDTYNITLLTYAPNSLGALRNLGIDNTKGEYIIIFDDDDIHHPERIEKQINICLKSNVDGTLLRNFTAVIKNKWFGKKRYKCTMLPGLEGTLLFKKSDIRYPDKNQGEDTDFIKELKEAGVVIAIIDETYDLYEYNFYGKNTVSRTHFKNMIESNKPLRFE